MRFVKILLLAGVLLISLAGVIFASDQSQRPWESSEGNACFEEWIREITLRLNSYDGGKEYNSLKPLQINQYGVLESAPKYSGSTPVSPEKWANYGGNKYWFMWDYWHEPGGVWRENALNAAGVPHIRPYVLRCLAAYGERTAPQQPPMQVPHGGGGEVGSLPMDEKFQQFLQLLDNGAKSGDLSTSGGAEGQYAIGSVTGGSGQAGTGTSIGGQYTTQDLRGRFRKKGGTGTSAKEQAASTVTDTSSGESQSSALSTVTAPIASGLTAATESGTSQTAPQEAGDSVPAYYLGRLQVSAKINGTPCGLTFYSCAECTEADIQWLLKMMDVAKKKYLTEETEHALEAEECVKTAELMDLKAAITQGPSKNPISVPKPASDCPCSNTPRFQAYLNSEYEPDCTPYEAFKKAKVLIKKELGY